MECQAIDVLYWVLTIAVRWEEVLVTFPAVTVAIVVEEAEAAEAAVVRAERKYFG